MLSVLSAEFCKPWFLFQIRVQIKVLILSYLKRCQYNIELIMLTIIMYYAAHVPYFAGICVKSSMRWLSDLAGPKGSSTGDI